MSIYRTQKTRNYTTVGNEFINDPSLSAKAKGILLYLLSKPDNWETRTEDIVAHMADGIDSIKSGIKELRLAGYMLRKQVQNKEGRFVGWETRVFETPLPKVDFPSDGKTESGKTRNRKIPKSENPPLINTEVRKVNTELLTNTEKESTSCPTAIADRTSDRQGEVRSEESQASTPVNQEQAIADAETQKPSTSRRRKKKQPKSEPQRSPELFAQWWESYYKFCLKVDCSAGKRQEAVEQWDNLLDAGASADELQEATAWYIKLKTRQYNDKGEASAVSHGCRYLRDGKWREALDHKRIKTQQPTKTEAVAIAAKDWNTDPRFDEWLALLQKRGPVAFIEVGKGFCPERIAFAEWAKSNQIFHYDVDLGRFLNG